MRNKSLHGVAYITHRRVRDVRSSSEQSSGLCVQGRIIKFTAKWMKTQTFKIILLSRVRDYNLVVRPSRKMDKMTKMATSDQNCELLEIGSWYIFFVLIHRIDVTTQFQVAKWGWVFNGILHSHSFRTPLRVKRRRGQADNMCTQQMANNGGSENSKRRRNFAFQMPRTNSLPFR